MNNNIFKALPVLNLMEAFREILERDQHKADNVNQENLQNGRR